MFFRRVRANSHPEVEVKIARSRKKHKSYLRWTRLLAAAQPLQAGTGLLVELPGEASRQVVAVLGRREVAEERLRRELRHLGARGGGDGRVAGDQGDALVAAVLRREPFEQRVGVRGVPHRERPAFDVVPDAVEDDDAACTANGDERREGVD